MQTMTPDPARTLMQIRDGLGTARDLDLCGADLRGADLSGLRADGLRLDDCDLRDARLTRVVWRGCSMRDARLEGADLSEATLRLGDLEQVRADRAILVGARIEDCSARAARLDGADLSGASLTATDLSRASLRGACLQGVSALGADLRGADLRGARLGGASLAEADLRGADLREADLTNTDLSGADLRGALGLDPASPGCGIAPPWEPEDQAPDEHGAWSPGVASQSPQDLPEGLLALAESMAPLVRQVLETAGSEGLIDPKVAEGLAAQARTLGPRPQGGTKPGSVQMGPSPEVLGAVARVLTRAGGQTLPALLAALAHPRGSEPPPEVKGLILSLRNELGLPEDADSEAVLSRLLGGWSRTPADNG